MVADDQVVEQFDADNRARFHQPLRHTDVFR